MNDETKLRDLIKLMHSALQMYCDSETKDSCLMWPNKDKQCILRDIEAKMKELEIDVEE